MTHRGALGASSIVATASMTTAESTSEPPCRPDASRLRESPPPMSRPAPAPGGAGSVVAPACFQGQMSAATEQHMAASSVQGETLRAAPLQLVSDRVAG